MNFLLNLPYNATSLGNVSFAISREIYNRGLSPSIMPIGQPDLSAQKPDPDFFSWLQAGINKSYKVHSRDNWSIKNWHPSSSLDSFSKKSALIFFHETDSVTECELNVMKNHDICFTSSSYTQKMFNQYGAENVKYLPLGFDSYHFKKITNKEYLGDKIVFGLMGKTEERKNTLRILRLWARVFGNNPKYQLDCLIYNHFVSPEKQEMAIAQALENKRYFNIKFFPWIQTNTQLNDFKNHLDLDLTGLSGMECFNLPAFDSLVLGKWGVFLDAHVHKDYIDSSNAILVQPTKMRQAADGLFFHPGTPWNQGNWFDYEDDAAVAAMEMAVKKAKTPNPAGEALAEKFNYKNTVDIILSNIQKVI